MRLTAIADLLWHIDMADQLGDALSALLSANTRLQMEGALADMRIQLAQLEAHSDLDRFVRYGFCLLSFVS